MVLCSLQTPAAPHREGDAVMARLRAVYDSGAVPRLPFLRAVQLSPYALLNDPCEGYYMPSTTMLPLVRCF